MRDKLSVDFERGCVLENSINLLQKFFKSIASIWRKEKPNWTFCSLQLDKSNYEGDEQFEPTINFMTSANTTWLYRHNSYYYTLKISHKSVS